MQRLRSNSDRLSAYDILKVQFGAAYETSNGICNIFYCSRDGNCDVITEHIYRSADYSDLSAPGI